MTAEENVLVGRHVRMKQSPLSSLLHGPRFKRSEAEAPASAPRELLEFVGLQRFSDELARNLPYGDQRRLRSPARWRRTRRCCCSTSRPPG